MLSGVPPSPGTEAPGGQGVACGKGGLCQAGRLRLPWSTPTLVGWQLPQFSRLLELAVNCFCPVLELHRYPPNYLSEIIVGTELK